MPEKLSQPRLMESRNKLNKDDTFTQLILSCKVEVDEEGKQDLSGTLVQLEDLQLTTYLWKKIKQTKRPNCGVSFKKRKPL